MALQTALTNGQLTAIRSDGYQALQFVCLVPNSVVVQFQPSAAPSSDVFAEIAVGSVASGSMSNIQTGQLVIFSTTSDYRATELFRTRVRKVSGTSTLYVGENSTTLTTSYYVTVIDTYEIQEKLRRSETLCDWDITYRKLLPVETALPSAVVLSNGTTSYAPTASPKAMDVTAAGGFTHAWESSNANDSIADETTASPTFTLEAAAFRWLRYTYTDSNGNSNYRVIPCWTVPKDYSSVVSLGFVGQGGEVANIGFDAEYGWAATVPAWDGIDTLLNKTFCVIASDEWYNDTRQSIRTNINMVGYLQTENVQTSADERYGRVSETQFAVEGFGHQLARQNISPVTVIRETSPDAWDEIKNPTPGRMLTYRLTEYSTASTLMAIKIPSDDTDFIGDDLTLSTEKALDDLNFIASSINAEIQFDVTGKLELCRDLIYLDSTARNAAPVVATLTPADFASQYSIEYEYGRTTAQVTVTGGAYSTSDDEYDLFEAITPAEARYTEGDPLELSNQVLTTDNTASESIAEISQRAANFLAANNPTWTLRVALKDAWHFLVPDVGAWFKFTVAAADTVRGKSFGSSDRWQLVQIDISSNSQTGTREVNAVFRHETQSTGASVRATPIIHDDDADIVTVPAVFPPLAGGDLSLTDGFHYDGHDPRPPSEPNPVEAHCELGGFRPKSGSSYSTTQPALNGERITWRVRGSGRLLTGVEATETVNATTNPFTGGGATGVQVVAGQAVTFSATGTWSIDNGANTYDADGSGGTHGSAIAPSAPLASLVGKVGVGGSWFAIGASSTVTMPATGELYLVCNDINSYADNSGSVTVDIDAPAIMGDAFYYWSEGEAATPYDTNEGLTIETSQPTAPPYNENHEYTGAQIVTSGPILYQFNSPYADSAMSNWSLQIVTCFYGLP